jgi:hypothetical protein
VGKNGKPDIIFIALIATHLGPGDRARLFVNDSTSNRKGLKMKKHKLFLILFFLTLSACTTGQKKTDDQPNSTERMERYQMMFHGHPL